MYDRLRQIAVQKMANERADHTLQATALVHEAYIRLLGDKSACWENREHFFRAAGETMRRVLIDHARAKGSSKRGGGRSRVPLDLVDLAVELDRDDILALDEIIQKLDQEVPELSKVVRLRFYAGLSIDQTADALKVSSSTIDRQWTYARAWLFREWKKRAQ